MDGNGSNGGSSAADRLAKFRVTRPPPPRATPAKRKRKPRRPPILTPYGSIPYTYTDKLQDAGASGTTWALLFHLDRLIYGPARKEPLTLTAETYKAFRLSRHQVGRALRELEQAGLITVRRGSGRHNVVFPLWRQPPP
jgi:hypothetical protein